MSQPWFLYELFWILLDDQQISFNGYLNSGLPLDISVRLKSILKYPLTIPAIQSGKIISYIIHHRIFFHDVVYICGCAWDIYFIHSGWQLRNALKKKKPDFLIYCSNDFKTAFSLQTDFFYLWNALNSSTVIPKSKLLSSEESLYPPLYEWSWIFLCPVKIRLSDSFLLVPTFCQNTLTNRSEFAREMIEYILFTSTGGRFLSLPVNCMAVHADYPKRHLLFTNL